MFLTSASPFLHGSVFAWQNACSSLLGLYARSCVTCRFAHLVNYGGSYYSYAYAMCLASSVWEKLFQAAPLNRQAGEDHLLGGWCISENDIIDSVTAMLLHPCCGYFAWVFVKTCSHACFRLPGEDGCILCRGFLPA